MKQLLWKFLVVRLLRHSFHLRLSFKISVFWDRIGYDRGVKQAECEAKRYTSSHRTPSTHNEIVLEMYTVTDAANKDLSQAIHDVDEKPKISQ